MLATKQIITRREQPLTTDGDGEYRQTGAPQVKQGFVKDYYWCTGTHFTQLLLNSLE